MAKFLNLCPRDPDNWPMEIIDRLVETERRGGSGALQYALMKLMPNWDRVIEVCRERQQRKSPPLSHHPQ